MSKGNLFRACYGKGVSHHPLHLADTQLQAEEQKSFLEDAEWEQEGWGVPHMQVVGVDKLELAN